MSDLPITPDPLTLNHAMTLPKPPPPPGAIATATGGWLLPRQKGQTAPKSMGRAITDNTSRLRRDMAKGRLTKDDLVRISKGDHPDPAMWTAALDILESATKPNIADYDPVFSGEKTLKQLNDSGVDTRFVKKFRVKSKTSLSGDVEKTVDLELTDNRSAATDRIHDRTEGKARTTADVTLHTPDAVPTLDASNLTTKELEALLALTEKMAAAPVTAEPQDAQAVVTNPQIPRQQVVSDEEILVDIPEAVPPKPRPAPLKEYRYQIPMPVAPALHSQKEDIKSRMMRQYAPHLVPRQE